MNDNKQTISILDDLNAEITLAEFVEILRIQKIKELGKSLKILGGSLLELKDAIDRLPNCLCAMMPIAKKKHLKK